MKTVLTRVKATELPNNWLKRFSPDLTRTFRVVIEEEYQPKSGNEISGSSSPFAKRQQFLKDMAALGGNEDSDAWVKEIKASRVNTKAREPLE